jgi:hypothetical protein
MSSRSSMICPANTQPGRWCGLGAAYVPPDKNSEFETISYAPAGWPAGVAERALLGSALGHCAADVDDIIGNHAEADPSLHSDETFVAASVEAISALDHADASLASCAPLLAVAEPAFLLLAFAFGALGRAVRNADASDNPSPSRPPLFCRVECGVRRHQARDASEQGLMRLDGLD